MNKVRTIKMSEFSHKVPKFRNKKKDRKKSLRTHREK